MTLPTQYKELRELAEKATPGPWKREGRYIKVNMQQPVVCEVESRESRDNAAFIAAANPQTILALLQELEEARGLLAEASVAIKGLGYINPDWEKAARAQEKIDTTLKESP